MIGGRSASSPILDAALGYASAGWRVFPCSPVTKAPLLAADRDPAGKPIPNTGGFRKATTDPRQILAWWKKWPRAMIGAVTGPGMDAFVVDFDVGKDAETGKLFTLYNRIEALEAMLGCRLPETAMAITRNGGCHLYFALPTLPEGMRLGNRDKGLPFKINVRGDNTGYVIVPPSRMQEGTNYRWVRGRRYSDVGALSAPQALIDLLMVPMDRTRAEVASSLAPMRRSADMIEIDETVRRFVIAAIDGECRAISTALKGNRNNRLYEGAIALGSLVGAGAVSRTTVEGALLDVGLGLEGADLNNVTGTVRRGLDWGEQHPRDLSDVGGRAGQHAEHCDRRQQLPFYKGSGGRIDGQIGRLGEDALNAKLAFYPLTDLGNAERFRERHGHAFRWCPAIGWLAWDGQRWNAQAAGQLVARAVYDTVRSILAEAALVAVSGRQDRDVEGGLDFSVKTTESGKVTLFSDTIRQHARSSESASRIACIAHLAKAWLTVEAENLDINPYKINMLNGTLTLIREVRGGRATGRLSFGAADPNDLITKMAPVEYDPKALCPVYDAFLSRVQPKEMIRRFLHQWGGLSLTGNVTEQKLAFFYGGGSNGKSTLVDAWAWVAGEYSTTVPIETFLDQGRSRKGGDATPDLAQLGGVRLLRTSEPEKGTKLAEALIKLVTGSEPMKVRNLNLPFFELRPQFKLTVSGNHKPVIKGTDDGIWRRVMLVPWIIQIPDEEKDRDLWSKLRTEASGILNRLLAGLIDWAENRLIEPDDVTEATRKYREASDQLGRFLAECTLPKAGAKAKSSTLFQLFQAWAKATGAAEWQQVGFSRAMEDRGFEKKQSNGMQWLDLAIVKTVDDFREDVLGGGGCRPAWPSTLSDYGDESDLP